MVVVKHLSTGVRTDDLDAVVKKAGKSVYF